jgi:hypothetical protein
MEASLKQLEKQGYEEVVSGFNDQALLTRIWRRQRDDASEDNLLITVQGSDELCLITTLDEQSAPAG